MSTIKSSGISKKTVVTPVFFNRLYNFEHSLHIVFYSKTEMTLLTELFNRILFLSENRRKSVDLKLQQF